MTARPLRVLMCAASDSDPASRFRVFQFVPHLRQLGWEVDVVTPTPGHYWRSPLTRWRAIYWASTYAASATRLISCLRVLWRARNYDLVVLHRPLVPESCIGSLEPWLQHRSPRIIFDFDDAIHLVGENGPKVRRIVALSTWVTPGNAYLAEFARQHNERVTVIPTVIDTDRHRPVAIRQPGPVRIGWTGSKDTVRHHLSLLKPLITKLSREEQFEFVVIADHPPNPAWPDVPMRFITWSARSEVADHQLIDIGLMPLQDAPLERGKCGAKLLIYGALGCPAVASPVGVNSEIIRHEQTGFLATRQDEWETALRQLLRDPALRMRMGQAARKWVEEHYSVRSVLPELLEVFQRSMELSPSREDRAWNKLSLRE
jgi:glycosyltransferase involved in cell wall biosynthesis